MSELFEVEGKVEVLNMSPKGFYEGVLLKQGKKRFQVNFPKHGGWMAEHFEAGADVRLLVEEEADLHGEPEHEVYRLYQILGEGDEAQTEDEVHGFKGKVVRLNYALHGEVNGGILDSGDFLHLKPEGAKQVELKKGLRVAGEGRWKPAVNGTYVIEASLVNGIPIEHKKPKGKKRP